MRFMTTLLSVLMLTTGLTAQQPPEFKPGPEYELLKESEGTWDATLSGDQGKGTMTCKLALGGRWLLEHFKADFGGMPFEGHGGTSYDAAKKKYVSVWIDSMSNSPTISEGTYDKTKKTLTFVGTMPTPDGKSIKATLITVYKDANTKTFTVKGTGPDGKDFEMFQINYKRRAN
jgi:hypothetical protein